jgi:hypothetical protein
LDQAFELLLWTGIALLSVVAVVVVPFGQGLALGISVLAAAGSFLATISMFRPEIRPRNAKLRLMRRSALRTPPMDLPKEAAMRDMLALELRRVACADPAMPPDADTAVAQIVSRVMSGRRKPSIAALTRDDVVELILLRRLLRAGPHEAGALAQLFQRPDVVLDLRDEVQSIAARRASYERDMRALEATRWQWAQMRSDRAGMTLVKALQRLDASDIDLWHRVVAEHDPSDPAQRAAAFWCVRQVDCDRATLALFLADVIARDAIPAAARSGDEALLETVAAILAEWEAGAYATAELHSLPAGRLEAARQGLSAALDGLALSSGRRRWPDPIGLFEPHAGRAPRPRNHWDLARGVILRAPDPDDYRDPRWAEPLS